MRYLNFVDYGIILGYLLVLLVIGQVLKKRASASMEDYFIGGRKMPWWALGMSSMAAWLDMTGTMIIVSFLYLMGPRAMFIEGFRGGACLVLVFIMLFTAKWHRRSGVITGAEWMVFRFGNDNWAKFARVTSVIGAVGGVLGLLAYSFKGAGLFLSMFLPFSPLTCTVIMLVVTILYTMEAGFYGVIVTDIFQSICIWIAVVFVSILAVVKTIGIDFATLSASVTGNNNWLSSFPQWKTEMPAGYENYSFLTLVGGYFLIKMVFQGLGSGADPKYFGARNDRECGLLNFMCGWLMMLRWPLMLGFTILGLLLVRDLFPDHSVLEQATALIKSHLGNVPDYRWEEVTAGIINNPGSYSSELINGLKGLFGNDFASRLMLLKYNGTINPERILPAVLLHDIPMGMRGLIIVALLAAAMSTFNALINWATGFFTRDIWQAYVRPKASNKELISVSWAFGFLLVVTSFIMGYYATSINQIWGWVMGGLAAGFAVPSILRLYWWRFNAGGYGVGMLVGMAAAFIQAYFWPNLLEWYQFAYVLGTGIIGSAIGTYITKPTDSAILENFYKKTRPFGAWGPLKKAFGPEFRAATKREHFYDIISIPFALGWLISILFMSMQAMLRQWQALGYTSILFAVSMIGLYFFWFTKLPPAEDKKVAN
ncbi:MAG TPA: sodium:solute symporter [bacterium]